MLLAVNRGVRRNRTVTPQPGGRHGISKLYFGYSRVSTDEQADGRNGLEAQQSAIDTEAARRSWTVQHLADEGASGKYINANLQEALQLLASGQGDGLIVAKLDRLARSIVHAANIDPTQHKHKAGRWSCSVSTWTCRPLLVA